MAERATYNPWSTLRGRAHLTLVWGNLAGSSAGIIDFPQGRCLWLDARLGRRQRKEALEHELQHDKRGLPPPDAPVLLVSKEEAIVRIGTVEQLVSPLDLDALAATGEQLEVWEVAELLDVSDTVARAAVARWRQLQTP